MNLYKSLTFLLSGILLIILIVFIAYINKPDTNKNKPLKTYEVTKEEYALLQFLHSQDSAYLKYWDETSQFNSAADSFARKQRIHPKKTGKIIKHQKAKDKMAKFRKFNRNANKKPIITPYAFAFGKENIKNMLAAMERENSHLGTHSTALDSIQGVRIYLTLTDTIPSKPYLDLLFVPVRGDGSDYLQVDKNMFARDSLLLNTSAPCPNLCDN